jgi:hypothetical protein
MKTPIIKMVIPATLALMAMSCPPSTPPAIATGVWLFTVSTTGGGDDLAGLTLLPGGQTENPVPPPATATDEFTGTLAWAQNGSTFSLSQVIGVNNELLYTANVQSSTSMNGAWMRTVGGVGSGTWSAVLVP